MATAPLTVDITPLKRQPGVQRPFVLSLASLDDVELATAEVRADELHLDLLLEVAGEELIVTGTIGVDWSGPCRRCLEPQQDRAEVELREIFQRAPIEGETYPLGENEVDLEPMVREAVLLHLPVAPLCQSECAGPDPDRFPTSVASETPGDADDPDDPDAGAPPIDPRWAALGELTFDD